MKRLFDILITFTVLLLLAPLFFFIWLLVVLKMGRPAFFIQKRPGYKGVPFQLIKFRTMKDTVDRQGKPLADEERLTPFGRFLRSSSLDELPELLNVLKGDMSLVGPRPLLMEYLELYTDEQARRHDVHPGITGWAQVNGRNNLSWEEKFEFDAWYVDNLSFGLDIKILWMTIGKLFSREGINQPGSVTAEKFTGTPRSNDN